MEISHEQFQQLFLTLPAAQVVAFYEPFCAALLEYQIETPLRIAAYAAQIGHESNDLRRWEENLNYSAARLMAVWPARFPTLAVAKQYANKPSALAEKVYSRRMGNVKPGDGWRFRGRCPLQATGREMYAWLAQELNQPLESNPDLLLQPHIGFRAAAAIYAKRKQANLLADSGTEADFKAQTKRINGGLNGYEDRKARWLRNQELLGIQIVKG